MPSDICIIFYSVSQYRTGKGLSSLAWQDFWHSQPAAPHRPNPCCCSFLLLRGSQAACLPLTVGQAVRGGGGCGEAPGTEDPHERRAETGMGGYTESYIGWEVRRSKKCEWGRGLLVSKTKWWSDTRFSLWLLFFLIAPRPWPQPQSFRPSQQTRETMEDCCEWG